MKYILMFSCLMLSGCFYEQEKLESLPPVATPCFSCAEEQIINNQDTKLDINKGL